MKFLKNYKVLLALWLAIGISLAGYFYLFPAKHFTGEYKTYYIDDRKTSTAPVYEDWKEPQVFTLVTIVGSILIFGIGSTVAKPKT